ncbi:hypothetical protein Syun_028419 [Stephania yunnanensis]|uniref:Uncharacterized protein n=1 Tax=Stephania yunnanensis TaxID=152371 RepID=A0AAP0HLW7_9MAGN
MGEMIIRSKAAWSVVVAMLVLQAMVAVVSSRALEDQKNYYPPSSTCTSKCSRNNHPSHGSSSPSHGSSPSGGHGSYTPTPSTPSTPSVGNCGTPPSGGHHTPTPSTPSTPSYTPTPSTPSTPSYTPTPSTPSTPSYTPTPSTPSTPTPTTPTPVVEPPPTYTPTPVTPTPVTPTPVTPTPVTPTPVTPTPVTPTTPTPPSPLFPIDPNAPPPFTGTCNYWSSHPDTIWALCGWWATIGGIFPVPTSSTPSISPGLTLPQALTNTRTDGFGALYREGTASLLNSMVNSRFPYTTEQVRNHFVSALVSNRAASNQAELFKKANEGRLKPRA